MEIGFKMTSYCIEERKGNFTAEVEIKNNVTTAIPINFNVTCSIGEAHSEVLILPDLLQVLSVYPLIRS